MMTRLFIGCLRPHPEVPLMIQTTGTEEIIITGRYGILTNHLLSIGMLTSAFVLNLDSNLSLIKRQLRALLLKKIEIFSVR